MKRWKVGKRDWHSWTLGSMLIVLFLAQLLIVPHAVLAATTFDVTVAPVNVAPSFTKGTNQTVLEDCGSQTVSEWATSMSAGPADEAGQTLDFVVTNDNNALFSVQPTVAANGTLTYMPATNGNGMATVTVSLHDNGGTADGGVNTSAPQTFSIMVSEVNDTPTAVADAYPMLEDGTLTLKTAQLLSNDLKGPANESGQNLVFVSLGTTPANCTVSLYLGTITVHPTPDYNGLASFEYTIRDNGTTAGVPIARYATGMVNITVTAIADIVPDMVTTAEDTRVTISVLANDTFEGTPHVTAVGAASHGAVVINVADDIVTYAPDPDYNGGDSFTYTATSPAGVTETATVTVTITAVVDIAPDAVTTDEDTTVTFNAITGTNGASADNFEGTPAITAVTQGTHGAVTFLPDGTITYTPVADYNGTDSFTYSASSAAGVTETATVGITINAVNDAPSFIKGADQTVDEDCGAQTVVGWGNTISAGPADEAGQAIDFIVTNDNTTLFSMQPAVAANGTLTFTPAAKGNGTASVTVSIHDNGGTVSDGVGTSAPQMFAITVTAVNDPPVDTYTLTYTSGTNGMISGISPQTVNQAASGTLVIAVPNVGYHFVSWSDNNSTTAAARTDINVTANVNVTAAFAINTHTLTYSSGANATTTGTTPQTVGYGASGTHVTAVPNAGYHFVKWSDGILTTARTDSNVTANVNVSATFAIDTFTIDTYILTYTAGVGGSITGASPQTVNQGAGGTTVTATPNGGYHFVSWSDGVLTVARTDTNVTANINATATFAVNINTYAYTYTLTVTKVGNGTVTLVPAGETYNYGTVVTLTATPAAGYTFTGWSGDLTGSTNPATITMDAGKTITATYAPLVPRPAFGHTMVLTIGSKTMIVDGVRVALDASAAIFEDRTFIPLRALVEQLGGAIAWNAKTRQVTIEVRGTTIVFTIGKATALVNGKSLAIDPKNSKVVPVISSGRSMLPLRFVAENLGFQVGWNAKSKTITLTWGD